MPNLIERLFKKNIPQQPVPPTPRQELFDTLTKEVMADAAKNGRPITDYAARGGAHIRSQGWELE